ncbi:hypothetical protein PQX77_003116, partial [Marasmius sp. AFHP31]
VRRAQFREFSPNAMLQPDVRGDAHSWPDGMEEVRTSTLEAYGAPLGSGYSAMAQTVGVPCGIATQLVLDGAWKGKVLGVTAPYTKEICDPIRERLEKEGLGMVERIL